MKILHLYSDWKWTGPAESVLQICKGLQERGHQIVLAYRKPPFDYPETIERFVRDRGIVATDTFRLNRYLSLTSLPDHVHDLIHLPRFIREESIQILNVHLSYDHFIGGIAARSSFRHPAVIRTDHKRKPIRPTLYNKLLLRTLTDGLVTFSKKSRNQALDNFRLSEDRVERVTPAIDSKRLSPGRVFKDMRSAFGIAEDDVVVGVVARFQRYRKMNLFFEGFTLAAKEVPNLKALLIGTSSKMKETILEPIAKHRLANKVVLAGYLTNTYIAALACIDIFVMMIAGSDGTGRALREAMAMGKVVLVNNTGMLAEMVDEGQDGFVFDNNPGELSRLVVKLALSREMRIRMGRAARRKARNDFSIERQVLHIEDLYRRVLARISHTGS